MCSSSVFRIEFGQRNAEKNTLSHGTLKTVCTVTLSQPINTLLSVDFFTIRQHLGDTRTSDSDSDSYDVPIILPNEKARLVRGDTLNPKPKQALSSEVVLRSSGGGNIGG